MKGAWSVAVVLLALGLGGCQLGTPEPKYIPPPVTPTDSREVARVQRAVKTYRFDARLVGQQQVSCRKGIPPDLVAKICKQFVSPLLAQQGTHLRTGVGQLRGRVGPRCQAAIERVFAVAVSKAGPNLERSVRVCRAEYQTDLRAPRPGSAAKRSS